MLLSRSLLSLTFIAGLTLVCAFTECERIKFCKEQLKKSDGSEFETVKYAIPYRNDLDDMCVRQGYIYLSCMSQVDKSKCHEATTRDDGTLTESLVQHACFQRRSLRDEECLSPKYSNGMPQTIQYECGPHVDNIHAMIKGVPQLGDFGCRLAENIMNCVITSATKCAHVFYGFYASLTTSFGSDCDENFHIADAIYKKITSSIKDF